MLDYSLYRPVLIVVAPNNDAFLYWVRNLLPPLSPANYGRWKDHWLEYMGKRTREECRQSYPATPILEINDRRISGFLLGKLNELRAVV